MNTEQLLKPEAPEAHEVVPNGWWRKLTLQHEHCYHESTCNGVSDMRSSAFEEFRKGRLLIRTCCHCNHTQHSRLKLAPGEHGAFLPAKERSGATYIWSEWYPAKQDYSQYEYASL